MVSTENQIVEQSNPLDTFTTGILGSNALSEKSLFECMNVHQTHPTLIVMHTKVVLDEE